MYVESWYRQAPGLFPECELDEQEKSDSDERCSGRGGSSEPVLLLLFVVALVGFVLVLAHIHREARPLHLQLERHLGTPDYNHASHAVTNSSDAKQTFEIHQPSSGPLALAHSQDHRGRFFRPGVVFIRATSAPLLLRTPWVCINRRILRHFDAPNARFPAAGRAVDRDEQLQLLELEAAGLLLGHRAKRLQGAWLS